GTGGRYDSLLGRFGLDRPATGFVVHVDRCCDALLRGEPAAAPTAALVLGHAAGATAAAMAVARRLRSAGLRVAAELDFREARPESGVDLFVDADGTVWWLQRGAWRSGGVDEAVLGLATAPGAV